MMRQAFVRPRSVVVIVAVLVLGSVALAVVPLRDGVIPGLAAPEPAVAAMVHVASRPPYILHDPSQSPLAAEEIAAYRQTQQALIKSRPVLNMALKDKKVAALESVRGQGDPVTWLQKAIRTEYLGTSEVLRISINEGTLQEQAILANAVVDAYLMEVVDAEHNKRLTRLEQLKKIYSEFDIVLKDKRKQLRVLSDDLGSKDAKFQALRNELAAKQVHALQDDLVEAQREQRKVRLEQAMLARKSDREAEDRLKHRGQVLAEHEKQLREELNQQLQNAGMVTRKAADLEWLREEIDQVARMARRIGDEVQVLQLEIQSPRRVRLFDTATAPGQ